MRLAKALIALLATVALTLVSCSGTDDIDHRLDEAAQALSSGDNAGAKSLCDALIEGKNASKLTAPQLGALSIMYMQIGEAADMDDNTATAFQCYRNAFKADSTAAAAYYAEISGENSRYVQMLSALLQMVENPRRNDIEEYEDSIP